MTLADSELKLAVKPGIEDLELEELDGIVDTVDADDDPGQLVSPWLAVLIVPAVLVIE